MELWVTIVLIIVFGYILLIWVLSQLFIPNLGWKRNLDEEIPNEVKTKLKSLVKSSKTKKELLQKIVDYENEHFYGRLFYAFVAFKLLFNKSFNDLWRRKGFLHCHQHALIVRYMLINSEKFSEEDIKLKIAYCDFNIHQFLLVNVAENKKSDNKQEWILVDAFATSFGFKIGELLPPIFSVAKIHARGFDTRNKPALLKIRKKFKNNSIE